MKASSKLSLLALPILLIGALSLLYFGALAPQVIPALLSSPLVDQAFMDGKLKYQLVSFGLALLVLALTGLLARKNAGIFYRVGNLAAPTEPVRWLGIEPGETWKTVGRNFAIIISVATGIFIYLNVAAGQTLEGGNARFLPYILLFSAMNAFTEEAIFRLSLVTALHGRAPNGVIYLASGLLFGSVHYFGVPGGILGSLMAGFLGWLLAKSIVETRGLFWAWFIHFLQDVIIFTGLFLAAL